MLDLGVLKASITLDDGDAKSKLSSFSKETEKAKTGLEGFSDKMTKLGESATKAGKKLSMELTAPLTAIGGLAIKAGMDFEAGMSKVQAISGSSAEDMKRLEEVAKEMGAKTKFSATEASEGLMYMAMAGWDAQKMIDGLPAILNLAAADGLDLATTSDIVTDAMTAFGLSAQEAGKFADILATASSASNTSVSMLGESFKYVAPVAGAFGYSAEDTALGLGLMANAGIKASMAGTSMRQILTNLTGVLELNVGGMKNWVIECENADGTMVPLRDQFVQLREAFAEMTEAERASNAEMIAGKVGMSGLLAIVTASDADFNNLIDNIDNSAGSAEKMAEIMQDNVKGQLVILGSALEGTAIAFYECIKEPLKEAITWLGNFVSSLIPVIEENGQLIAVLGGVLASVGPLVLAFGKVVSVIGALTNPITLVIAGLSALGVALTKLYMENEDFAKAVNELWASVQKMLSQVLSSVKELFQAFTKWCNDIWEKYGEEITTVTVQLVQFLETTFKTVFTVLQQTIKFFTSFFKGDFEGMSEAIRAIISTMWQFIKNAFFQGLDMLQNIVPLMVQLGKDMINGLWNGIKSVWSGVTKWIGDAFNGIINNIKGIFDIHSPSRVMKEIGKNVTDGFANGLKDGEKDVNSAMSNVGNTALGVIRQYYEETKNLMGKKQTEQYEQRKQMFQDYIADQKYYNKLSLDEEYNLYASMKELAKANRAEVKYWEKEMYRVKQEMRKEDIQDLKDANAKYRELYMQQVKDANAILTAKSNEEIKRLEEELELMDAEDKAKAYEERYKSFEEQIKRLEKELAMAEHEERKAIKEELSEKEKEFDDWLMEEERKKKREELKAQIQEERELLEQKIKNNEAYAEQHIKVVNEQLEQSIKAIENGVEKEKAVQESKKTAIESIEKESLETVKTNLTDRENALTQSNDKVKSDTENFATEMYKENYGVGASFANGLADGILNQTYRVTKAISMLVDGMKVELDRLNTEGIKGINGSHANGINHVPYDGYVAELHKGERVLTAEQARNFTDISTSRMESLLEQLNTKLDRLPRNLALETRF